MPPHTRALLAAAVFALISGRKVAGLYDHAQRRHVRIAAESRGIHLQGYDGERDVRFGGTLPEMAEAGAAAGIHLTVEGMTAQGYDRSSASHFTARVEGQLVQLFDHAGQDWFAYQVQTG